MNRKDISGKQMQSTVALFLMGSSVISSGSNSAKQDTWITVLIAVALMIPFAWIHAEILKLYPGQNFFCIILRTLGRPVGLIVCMLYVFYFIILGAQVLRTFFEFIHIGNMIETPMIAIAVIIMATVVFVLSKRLYVLARVGRFVLPVLYLTIFMTIVLSFKYMTLNNLKPILHTKLPDFLNGILNSFVLPYGELIVCVPMFGAMNRKEKLFPTMVKGILLAFVFLFTAMMRNILVLGYSASVSLFPSYECVSVIRIGAFFTRIEIVIGINLVLAGFIKLGVLVFSSCEGVTRLFGLKDYEPLIAPFSLLILTLSLLLHSDTAQVFNFIKIYPVIALPFQVLLPILILIVGKIHKKMEMKKGGRDPAKTGKESISPNPQDS
ncbi:GerAB/ArcD/ProY family transporter [Caproicibacter sp. BJN0012]|uniref:GerAB/ArcD/ProY family transporter n=1 Tax=Caproicibacter sp. BJN0012 TaxID=3110227 RepID=UPI002E131CA1|nr:endospore germination permease [Caproicibacter sp. BJN0012]